MRNQASSWVSFAMIAGVATAGFLGACGGKVVVDASNPAGAGGAGGAGGGFAITSGPITTGAITTGPVITGPITTGPITTGPITTGSTMTGPSTTSGPITTGATMEVAVSVGPASATGGVNACQEACDKASMCGLNFCGQFGINCGNPPPQAECPLACVANGSCSDIAKLANQNFATPLGACILGCQGTGPGGAQASVGSGPPPPPMGCQQCTLQQCGGPIFACNSKKGPGSCSHWLQCAQNCGADSMCLFGCDGQFPNAKAQYDGVYSCLCSKCDASCPSEDACAHLGASPSSGTAP